MSLLIPKDFRKIAETDDQYTRTKVVAYYNTDTKFFYFTVESDDPDRAIGPFNKLQLQTVFSVIGDVKDMKNPNFLE